jgi:transcriptional regulator with XRE-family HTH domain
MNDELKALLEEAYNRGASKSDLDQIVNRYNQKKKEPSEASDSTSLEEPSASDTSAEVPAPFGEVPKFEGTKDKEPPKTRQQVIEEQRAAQAQKFADIGSYVGQSIAEGVVSANTYLNRAAEILLLGNNTNYFSSNSAKLLEPLNQEKERLQSEYVGKETLGEGFTETFQRDPVTGAKRIAFEFGRQVPQMYALGAIGRSTMLAEGATAAGLRTGSILAPRTKLVKKIAEDAAPMIPLGMSSAGQAYLDAAEKNPEDDFIDAVTNLAVATYKGTSEIASELMFRTSVDDLIRGGFRKGLVSDIAKSTRPTLQAAKQVGKDVATEGFQEGLEELAVEISSNAMDALVFGEDMFSKSNLYGMADAFILGSAIGSPITLLSKGPSAIGTANNINKRRNISEEINDLYDVHQDPNTSASEKAVVKGQIINKLAELKQVENNLASFYEEFSEEDRNNVISLNQELSMAQLIYPELKNEQSKDALQEKVKQIYSEKTKIESKYDPNIKVYEYDSQKEAGVPSPVAEGEAAVEAQPVEGAGKEATPADRVLQAREKLILESIGMDATLQAVERGEEVEQSDVDAAQERILQLIDDVDKSDIPADAKQAYIQTLEDKFDELEYYDNKTITTTEQVTEEVPVGAPRAGSRTVVEPEVRRGKFRLFERLNNLEVAVGTETDGQTSVIETQEDGSIDVVTYDKATKQEVGRQARVADNILGLEYVESIFDGDGNITGVVMRPKTAKGQDVSSVRINVLNRPELAMDIAIDARKKQIGDIPEVIWTQEYETVTREVTTKEKVPAKKRPSEKAESETESVVEPVKEVEVEEDVVEVAQVVPRAKNKNNLTEAVADNAIAQAERLAKRLGLNVKIITHNSRKAFDEAMDQLSKNGASDAAREGGRILFDRNEIHINLEDMTLSDPFHEVFHAAFVNRFAKGSQAQRTKSAVEFKNGILKVLRSGSAQDKQLADEVEQFVNDGDYNPSEKAEEFMAQTAGIIATNAQRISKSTMDKLMQWLNNFISKIAPSMKVTTRGEFIDFMNSFSGALFADTDSSVQTTESTVNLTSTNDLLDSSSRGDFTISYFEDTDQYKKFVDDGLVVNNFSLNQIAGQPVATHQPDNFMVGDVKLGDKVVVEGDGGVYFVLKFGEVWASGKPSSASGIAKAINWSRENSTDGKGRMLLARGTTPKLISSTKGVKGGMQILEEMVDRNLIPRKDFRASLIRVGKKYGIDFSGNDSMTSIKNDIEQKFMKPSDSTFAKRGLFFEDLISDISSTSTTSKENIDGIRKFLGSTKRISFSKEGITSAIAELMTERMLIDLPSSHAYAVIEVDNDVKVEKSKKHDSYPYSIVQVDGKRPTLYLLKDRPKAVPSLLTRDGERATNAKVGFAQMGYGRAIVDPALLAASATQESQVNKSYDELLESSSKQQVQLGMQQAQINYDIDTQLAESSSWQQRERTPMEKYNDLIRIKIQDKLYRVIKLQEDIEYSTGKPVGLDQDFRNAETLMHGKAANDLNESMDRAEKVAENVKKSGTTLEAFDDLLYALHAQERNRNIRVQRTNIAESITDLRKKSKLKPSEVAEMAGIDIETYRELEAGTAKKGITSEELNSILSVYGITPNKFYTDYSRENAGSGMTDIEAQTILSTYGLDPVNPDVKSLKPALRDAVNGVYAIIADSRERMLDYGLETLDTVVAFESMYKNYVPLRGFEGEDSASEIIGGGRSLEVRGREKRSLGRKSKADSPFLNAVAQNQSTIVRARKNEVAQRLYRLAEANPNDQIWKIVDPSVNKEYKKKATSKGIKDVAKTISDYILDDRNFAVRINGEYKFIQFTDPRMAEMLRGANVTKAEFITKYLGQFNRMLSSFITTYDPEFVLRNFSRDIQVAVINAISEQEIEGGLLKGKNVTTKVVKSVPGSIKAIFNMSKKDASPSNEFERYYKEFIEDGAKTEWFYSKSVDELRKDVDKLISDKKDTRFGSTKVKAAEDFSKNFIERINSSVENGVRLAAYMESRKAGLSRDKAAELAKNLTVNFNKSGEWGTVANSLYLFFNASVQGTSRLIRTLKPQFKKNDDGTRSLQVTTAQKIAVSMFIAGSLMSLLNEALSDDDEDEKSFYSKIPDFEKERNIIIMLPNGKDYFKIPLPYGLNVFYVAGNAMADAGQGLKSVGETATNILQAAIGSFSPINFPSSEDFSSWIIKFITPTIGQIPLSLALNEDYFGRTIYNENFPTDPTPKPESELGRKGATPQSSWIAKELNKLTGGSEFRSGMVDINPDKIDFVLETLSGGAGRFALRSTSAIGNLITGNWDEIEANDIPFARVFYGQPRKFVNLQSYFDKRIEVNQYMEEVKSNNLNSKDSSIVRSMYSVSKSVDKALRNIKKMEKNAEQIKDEDAKRNRLLELERMRYTQLAIFQKAYEQYKIDEL